jgi:protein SCO1/2
MRKLILLFATLASLLSAGAMPDLPVTDHEGRTHSFHRDLIAGKTVIINFFYSECQNICPAMTSNIKRLNGLLRQEGIHDIHIYSLSLDPARDSVEKLAEYHKLRALPPNWKLLRASYEDVERIRKATGFVDRDPRIDADRSQHSGMLRIGNDTVGRWIALAADGQPAIMIRAIRNVLPVVTTARNAR